jgi:hypothetical protein
MKNHQNLLENRKLYKIENIKTEHELSNTKKTKNKNDLMS